MLQEQQGQQAGQEPSLASQPAQPEPGFAYESPLIEQGSVILGGTEQQFGFALRQQYFHKSVMLVLSHDKSFTRGIILNRPSGREIDGWRIWFGGDVAEGGTFHMAGERDELGLMRSQREINCLHSLTGDQVDRLSVPVIKGVSYTSLEAAETLVKEGVAKKEDFWVFVGYAGWGPGQLQGEVERDSWFLAAADSSVVLNTLLQQATKLPVPDAAVVPSDGIDTWERLMNSIGRSAEVVRTRGSLPDRTLGEWTREHLSAELAQRKAALPEVLSPASQVDADVQERKSFEGMILRAGQGTRRFVLKDQFLHKGIVLVIHQTVAGICIAVVLNRATVNLVEFKLDGRPRRCINFGGENRLNNAEMERQLGIDKNGLMWLHHDRELGGRELAGSGVYQVPPMQAVGKIKAGEASIKDYLLVSGVMVWRREWLEERIAAADFEPVPDARALWPQVWALADASNLGRKGQLSDGSALWWAAGQLERGVDFGVQAAPPTTLADETLKEWLKFFGGHSAPDDP